MSNALDKLFASVLEVPPEPDPSPAPVEPGSTGLEVDTSGQLVPKFQNPADGGEGILQLPVDVLADFPRQPFRPYTEEKMASLQASIEAQGVIEPLIVRPLGDTYQIVAGHNRRTAAQLAGLATVPCLVRSLSDANATLQMLETNLEKREDLLPSEKAHAYRMRMEIITHQGERNDLISQNQGKKCSDSNGLTPEKRLGGNGFHHLEVDTSGQLVQKFRDPISGEMLKSRDLLTDGTMTGRQAQNYIRLSYLTPELLELVDLKRLTMRAGMQLAFLSHADQAVLHQFFYLDRSLPIGEPLAQKLRELVEQKPMTQADLLPLLSPAVKPFRRISVTMKPIRKFFPDTATPKEVEKTIVAALAAYFKQKNI